MTVADQVRRLHTILACLAFLFWTCCMVQYMLPKRAFDLLTDSVRVEPGPAISSFKSDAPRPCVHLAWTNSSSVDIGGPVLACGYGCAYLCMFQSFNLRLVCIESSAVYPIQLSTRIFLSYAFVFLPQHPLFVARMVGGHKWSQSMLSLGV